MITSCDQLLMLVSAHVSTLSRFHPHGAISQKLPGVVIVEVSFPQPDKLRFSLCLLQYSCMSRLLCLQSLLEDLDNLES